MAAELQFDYRAAGCGGFAATAAISSQIRAKIRAMIAARLDGQPTSLTGPPGRCNRGVGDPHMQDFAAERATMVDTQIRTNDVTNKPLLEALYTVPREAYVPASARPLAYMDNDLVVQPASKSSPGRFTWLPGFSWLP